MSNSEGEEEVTSKSAIRKNTRHCHSDSESESDYDLGRGKERCESKSTDKRKTGHKISESEYESSSGKDDDLLDEAYREMKYVQSLDKGQMSGIKKRSNSIT